MKAFALLGAGSMGEAILAGYLSAATEPAQVSATVRRAARASELAAAYPIRALATENDSEANRRAVEGADLVVLGVKPAQIQALCQDMGAALSPHAVVVSVAGGVSIAQISGTLPPGQAVVRTMPNTPLAVSQGVVGYCANREVTDAQLAFVYRLFEPAGVMVSVREELMPALGAISGSGPAYVFYVAEALAAAACDFGFDEQTAALLATRTVTGAGTMLAAPGADAGALRVAVTSPKGSTERALEVFERCDLMGIVGQAAQAAAARSREVEAELG